MKKKRDNAKWIQAETVKKKENRRKGREKKKIMCKLLTEWLRMRVAKARMSATDAMVVESEEEKKRNNRACGRQLHVCFLSY